MVFLLLCEDVCIPHTVRRWVKRGHHESETASAAMDHRPLASVVTSLSTQGLDDVRATPPGGGGRSGAVGI